MCINDNPSLQLFFLRFGFLRSLSVLVANFKLTFYEIFQMKGGAYSIITTTGKFEND